LEKDITNWLLNKNFIAMMRITIIAVFVLLPNWDLFAQKMITGTDTVQVDYSNKDIKNPKTATILSAVIPGAGQVYNGKPWKVPIIYAGFAANIYFIEFNNRRYQLFREALFAFDKPGGPTNPSRPFPSLNREGLVRNVNYWKRNRDLNYFLFIGIYALNIIDANVDAHLSAFDVSDDLTFRFEPSYESLSAGGGNIMGLSLKINF
jgi:hypothetical protein